MTFNLSTIARQFQTSAVLASVTKLLKRMEREQRRRPRRSMNG